jgi:excisionase family DNA binding protein
LGSCSTSCERFRGARGLRARTTTFREDVLVLTEAETPQRRALMTLPEVARHLGVGERHVRRLVAERRIPHLKWGHLLRFDPEEIDAWLDQCRRPPAASPPRS